MSSGNNSNSDNNARSTDYSSLFKNVAVAAGVTALAGGLIYFTRASRTEQTSAETRASRTSASNTNGNTSSITSYLSNLIERVAETSQSTMTNQRYFEGGRGISSQSIPSNPVISNLNSLLSDIHVRFIALRMEDFSHHYQVFDVVFNKLHENMKVVDKYYGKYSSTVQFAGSHYDRLRIKKPDEFDIDIVIDLPLNLSANPQNTMESDIVIEPKTAGYVQLRMGVQFQRLPMRDGTEWEINKAAYDWKDSSNYLLRSNFQNWFKGVVNRGLNKFPKRNGTAVCNVGGVQYEVRFASEAGPAMTLSIEGPSGFKMDVDLVPALKFPESRWPIARGYRPIPVECRRDYWMVVGKPNKAAQNQHDQNRSFRLALHNQERELMHNSYNLRQAIRLIKKLRDAQDMNCIASYYIKTFFFWELERQNSRAYWRNNNPATIFKLMVQRLHEAILDGCIPYYWNPKNNLIAHVSRSHLACYAAKLAALRAVLDTPDQYKLVAKYLLNSREYSEYRHLLNI